MSKIENCIERRNNGLAPIVLECMECLKELSCPVYQEYKSANMNTSVSVQEMEARREN